MRDLSQGTERLLISCFVLSPCAPWVHTLTCMHACNTHMYACSHACTTHTLHTGTHTHTPYTQACIHTHTCIHFYFYILLYVIFYFNIYHITGSHCHYLLFPCLLFKCFIVCRYCMSYQWCESYFTSFFIKSYFSLSWTGFVYSQSGLWFSGLQLPFAECRDHT